MTTEEVINQVADRLLAHVTAITGPTFDQPVKGYKWATEPGTGFDQVPAAVVQIPTIGRTGIDQPEDHLGALDLNLTFDTFFVFDATTVDYTMPQAVQVTSAFIDAIDTDPSLNGAAQEAKVTKAEPRNVDSGGSSRQLFGYACTVEVLAFH